MYPMETLRREVSRYNENHVQAGRALGELGHPDGPTVNLDRVSHKIVSLKENGSNFIGKAKILNTPMGKIASSLIEEGVKLGVSSRGIGSLKVPVRVLTSLVMILCWQLLLISLLILLLPMHLLLGIMEGKEWVWDGGILREKYAAKKTTKRNQHSGNRNNLTRKS